jgi:drug/metabolite transporter superfamily protein YnfA
MNNFLRGIAVRLGIAGELLEFLWRNKKWWLIPMVFMLLVFGLLLIFASTSALGPFIYTLF